MIRQLHRDENVLFAGYKLPHPLQYKIIVRVSICFFTCIFMCDMWIFLEGLASSHEFLSDLVTIFGMDLFYFFFNFYFMDEFIYGVKFSSRYWMQRIFILPQPLNSDEIVLSHSNGKCTLQHIQFCKWSLFGSLN